MRVICYGDSNTFGYDPQAMFGEHYHPRWTDILSELTGWDVVNDGVNGREVPRERLSIPEDTDLFLSCWEPMIFWIIRTLQQKTLQTECATF